MSPIHQSLQVKYLTLRSRSTCDHDGTETLSHRYTTTYQISLTYLKCQSYCPDTKTLKKYQLFDLKVKGQTEVTMEHDTLSHDYTYTYIPNIIYLS